MNANISSNTTNRSKKSNAGRFGRRRVPAEALRAVRLGDFRL